MEGGRRGDIGRKDLSEEYKQVHFTAFQIS